MADVPQVPTGREESSRMAFISNALAIVGFIILFIIIVWGIFHIVNLSGTSIGSFFSSKPKVTVTAPKNGISGEPINVSWKYTGKESGTFSFLYKCDRDFYFGTSVGRVPTRIPCGNAINVGSSTSATLVPILSQTTSLDVPVTIIFNPQSGDRVQGEAVITIAAAPRATTTTPAETEPSVKPTKTTYPAGPVRRPLNLVPHAASGPADLSVRMILVGVIDPYSGALLPRAPISPNEIVGVEFDIANVGGSATGSWYFSAVLPTGASPYLYTSPLQQALSPGEHIVNVLRFSPNMRPSTLSVTVDPANRILEASETNNLVSQSM